MLPLAHAPAWCALLLGSRIMRTPAQQTATRLACDARMCDDRNVGENVAVPPEKLHNLLVQCSIQAQLSYHNEFHNEIMSEWVPRPRPRTSGF